MLSDATGGMAGWFRSRPEERSACHLSEKPGDEPTWPTLRDACQTSTAALNVPSNLFARSRLHLGPFVIHAGYLSFVE